MESVSLPQHLQTLKDQLSDASQANRKDTATLGDTLTTTHTRTRSPGAEPIHLDDRIPHHVLHPPELADCFGVSLRVSM